MQILVDTGVLLRAFDRTSAEQRPILKAFRQLREEGHSLATSHQNIAEFWNVATRPQSSRGGFGLSTSEAELRLQAIERLGLLLPFNEQCYAEWRQLLVLHSVVGVSVHDARLVGMMKHHGISHILTLNPRDFSRYGGIVAWLPTDVV